MNITIEHVGRQGSVGLARRWAELYRARGYNPLPSRPDAKRPPFRYAQWWETPAPEGLFDRFPTPNVQLMTGRRWRLLVVDLDGPAAREAFAGLARGPLPRTWTTHSGGDGVHLWFSLPAGFPRPLPKAILWRGPDRHAAVERLCDRSLIMVPPSIHPATGRRYRFASRSLSPARLPLPAPCPGWLLELAPAESPRPEVAPAVRRVPLSVAAGGRYRPRDVIEAIGDPVALARSWGLRVASSRPNGAGWIPCHAVGREDRTPSASISARTGRYWEPGEGTASIFDLAVRLGVYADRRDAVRDLGRRLGAREAGR